jgi:hypothetical protein
MGNEFGHTQVRLDASETTFFHRQLEAIDKRLYTVQFPQLLSRRYIPTQPDVPEWVSTYTYRMYDLVGSAQIIGASADDLPRADAHGDEESQVIKRLGAAYAYNIFEIRAAAAAGVPLDAMKASAARLAIGQKIDSMLAIGDSNHRISGLLSLPGITSVTPVTKTGGGTTWANATPAEIIEDVSNLVSSVIDGLNQAEGELSFRYVLLIPVQQHVKIATTRIGDGSDKTILRFILENNPWLESIEPWRYCSTAGSGGVARAVLYPRSEMVVAGLVPMEFQTLPPQQRNLEYVIDCVASCGGVVVRYPIAIRYMDGI